MSHGNAALERGFSVNGEMLVENLREETLVARRIVHDSVTKAGGLSSLTITKQLLLSMKNVHGRWKNNMDERKKKQIEEEKTKSEKRKVEREEKELKSKMARLQLESIKEIEIIDEQLKSVRK